MKPNAFVLSLFVFQSKTILPLLLTKLRSMELQLLSSVTTSQRKGIYLCCIAMTFGACSIIFIVFSFILKRSIFYQNTILTQQDIQKTEMISTLLTEEVDELI